MALAIQHNAGFFSCCSEALVQIIGDFNYKQELDHVDRSEQYLFYKQGDENLIPLFFNETAEDIPYVKPVKITNAEGYYQFTDYRQIGFDDIAPFVSKFFTPSQKVLDIVRMYEQKYSIDYENTCAVLYRGNDKVTECPVAPYEHFITQAIRKDLRCFVLPDELEFMQEFSSIWADSFTPDELPAISKDTTTANFYQVPIEHRAEYAAKFFAAVLVASKCKYLVTHTGNVSMWAVIYRGGTDGVHQWLNDKFIY